MFTANGYIGFLNVIRFDINEKNIARTPAALPVLFASGEEDPVGDYGKAVKKVFKLYTKYVDNVELRLYEDDRHELHSETNRQEVFEDLLEWIESDVLAYDIDWCMIQYKEAILELNTWIKNNVVLKTTY